MASFTSGQLNLNQILCSDWLPKRARYMGYWPSVRSRWLDIGQVPFLRVYGPRWSRGPQTSKKRTRPISSHLDRTSLVNKGFTYGCRGNFSCGTRQVVLTGQNSSTLPARVANQSAGFDWLILPARGAGQIIRRYPTRCVPQETSPRKPCSKSFIDQAWLDIGLVLFCMVMDLCNWNCYSPVEILCIYVSYDENGNKQMNFNLNYENCKPISICGRHVILHYLGEYV